MKFDYDKEVFGVKLFDYLEPLAQNPNFFSADDRLTQVLRPPLLEAQREVAVVYNKKTQLKERMKQAEAKRAAAFPKKAENWQEKLTNVAKSTSLAGGEAKLKAEEMVLDNALKGHKQAFGVKLYPVLENLEDRESWLPTDREVRTIYDNCRRDIEGTRKKAKAKVDELETLGVSRKEIQQERDAVNQSDGAGGGGGGGVGAPMTMDNGMYSAPTTSESMTPVHAPPGTASPHRDPFASASTSSLPVARPVTNPGYPSAETPVLAYATTTPVPPQQPYQQPYQQQQQQQPGFGNAGMAPMGGALMGDGPGGGDNNMGTGQSSSSLFGSQTNVMGGSANTGSFGAVANDDTAGDFMMGGSTGMGMSNFVGQQQLPQQTAADPWGGNDPFATGNNMQPQSQEQQQQQQQQQHKDSNLFLY